MKQLFYFFVIAIASLSANASLYFTPAALDFSEIGVGQQGKASARLLFQGDGQSRVSLSTTCSRQNFSFAKDCPPVMLPGQMCTIQIYYKPVTIDDSHCEIFALSSDSSPSQAQLLIYTR